MSSYYAPNKRQRESEQARKKQDKAARRLEKRARPRGEIEIVSAEELQSDLPSIEEAMAALERGASSPRQAARIPARLFVGSVSDDATDAELRSLFERIGDVNEAAIMRDRATRMPRGFAFVTMSDRKDASRAIEELDGFEFHGRRLVVNLATERGR